MKVILYFVRKGYSWFYPFVIFLFVYSNNIYADILYVPVQHETIQDAIDLSQPSDTVLIMPGEYTEYLFLEASLTIASMYLDEGDSSIICNTVMNGNGRGKFIIIDTEQAIEVDIVGIKIENFREDSLYSEAGAIYVRNSTINMKYCFINDNYSYYAGAIACIDGNIGIENCIIISNNSSNSAGAISAINSIINIKNSRIVNNSSGMSAGGIYIAASSGIINNNIIGNNISHFKGGGLSVIDGRIIEIVGNMIINNSSGGGGGVSVSNIDSIEIKNNYIANNVVDYELEVGYGGGILISTIAENALIEENYIGNNTSEREAAGIAAFSNMMVENNIIVGNQSPKATAIMSVMSNGNNYTVTMNGNMLCNNACPDTCNTPFYGVVNAKPSTEIQASGNDFYRNRPMACGLIPQHANQCTMTVVDNFWGHPSGPYHEEQNPNGQGDTVSTLLDVIPFSETPFTNFQNPVGPSLSFPADQATNDTLPILFIWEEATDPNPEDTVHYILELSLDEEFTDPDRYYFIPQPSRVVSWFDYENTYYWRVIAYDDVWLMDTSEVRELYVTSEDLRPRPFDLLSPTEDELLIEVPVTFTWNRAWDFTRGDTVRYVLELSPVDQFDDPITYDAGLDTFFTVDESQFEWDEHYRWRVIAEDLAGHRTLSRQTFDFFLTGVAERTEDGIPETWELGTLYPNPFNSRLHVVIGVPERSDVRVDVFDILGRQVETLHQGPLNAGWRRIGWHAQGPSGTYFVRVQAGGWSAVRKVMLVK